MLPFPVLSGFSRFFKGGEGAKRQSFFADISLRRPSLANFIDASPSRGIRPRFSHVSHVDGPRDAPKILPPIVLRIAVYVVDMLRLFPGHKLPYYSVLEKLPIADCTAKIPVRLCAVQCWLPGIFCVPDFGVDFRRSFRMREFVDPAKLPFYFSSFRIVIEKLAKPFYGWQSSCSHVVSPYVRGQGRALLTQRFRPVFHSRITVCSQPFGGSK